MGGTRVLSAATLTDADELERAVTVMEAVYDQAAGGSGPGDGQVPVGTGWVRWSRDASGSVVVRHLDGSGAESAVVAGSGGAGRGAEGGGGERKEGEGSGGAGRGWDGRP